MPFFFFKILQKLFNVSNRKAILLFNTSLASIFVVHAALTEAVSYIAASSEVLYTFFDLLSFYLILKSNSPKPLRLTLVAFLLLSGTLFKESSLIFLPLLVIYLWLFDHPAKKSLSITTLSTFLIYLFLRLILVHTPFQSPQYAPISEAPLFQRILTIPAEFTHYLSIIFYPDKLAVSQHFVIQAPTLTGFIIPLILSLTFVGGTLYLAWRHKSKLILFGLLWFLLGFGLISNIFPLDMTIAERWLYFPFVGFILLCAALLTNLPNKFSSWIALILLLTILPLGIRTVVRNSNWHDGLTLFSHDINISKQSFDLENNLGVELFRAGKVEEAKPHFENSIRLQPKWYFAYNNLGAVYEREGNWQKALELYQKTLTLSDYYLSYENIAGIMINHETPEKTREFTTQALKKLPNNPRLWIILTLSDYILHDQNEAVQAAQNAFELSPNDQTYYLYQQLKLGNPLNLN